MRFLVRSQERGQATAETAVALPALVFVLVAALWMVTAVRARLECVDAARAGARAASRGEAPSAVRSAASEAAPGSAQVQVTREGGLVTVDVHTSVRPLGSLMSEVPALNVEGHATAAVEGS